MAAYLDTSALAKLVISEAETEALLEWLGAADRDLVSCDLARAELRRAVRRAAPDRSVRARQVLDSLTLLEVTTSIFEHAGHIEPTGLRPLDAVHLAAALELGDDLDVIVTYDLRLEAAANAHGVPVAAPG